MLTRWRSTRITLLCTPLCPIIDWCYCYGDRMWSAVALSAYLCSSDVLNSLFVFTPFAQLSKSSMARFCFRVSSAASMQDLWRQGGGTLPHVPHAGQTRESKNATQLLEDECFSTVILLYHLVRFPSLNDHHPLEDEIFVSFHANRGRL